MKTVVACLITIVLQAVISHVAGIEWEHSAVLDNNFLVLWTPSERDVTFEVQVRTPGYVGLGFTKDGSQMDADMVIGWVDNNGQVHLQVSVCNRIRVVGHLYVHHSTPLFPIDPRKSSQLDCLSGHHTGNPSPDLDLQGRRVSGPEAKNAKNFSIRKGNTIVACSMLRTDREPITICATRSRRFGPVSNNLSVIGAAEHASRQTPRITHDKHRDTRVPRDLWCSWASHLLWYATTFLFPTNPGFVPSRSLLYLFCVCFNIYIHLFSDLFVFTSPARGSPFSGLCGLSTYEHLHAVPTVLRTCKEQFLMLYDALDICTRYQRHLRYRVNSCRDNDSDHWQPTLNA